MPKAGKRRRPPSTSLPYASDTISATNHDTETQPPIKRTHEVFYGDVHIGTIAKRNPHDDDGRASKRAWEAHLNGSGVELEWEICWPPPMSRALLSPKQFFEQA
jgi:hypothetical protein